MRERAKAPLWVVLAKVIDVPCVRELVTLAVLEINAPTLVVWVAKYGPSHFGWSLTAILAFCFLMRTMSPVLIWRGFTFLSLYHVVSAWYRRRLLTAWHLSSSARSFVSCSSSWWFLGICVWVLLVGQLLVGQLLRRGVWRVLILLPLTWRCFVTKWLRWAPLSICLWVCHAIFLRCLGGLCCLLFWRGHWTVGVLLRQSKPSFQSISRILWTLHCWTECRYPMSVLLVLRIRIWFAARRIFWWFARLWLLMALLQSIWSSTQWWLPHSEGSPKLLAVVRLSPLLIIEGDRLGKLGWLVPLAYLNVQPKAGNLRSVVLVRLRLWLPSANKTLV